MTGTSSSGLRGAVAGAVLLIALLSGHGIALPQAAVDLTRLPLGDGRVSAAPVVGRVWSCQTTFGRGGAFAAAPWIRADGSFDLAAKPVVGGAVSWPQEFAVLRDGETRQLIGNSLPNHPTGQYPVAPADPTYRYDPNPNAIAPHGLRVALPARPLPAAQPSCLPPGPIGVLLTGSTFFNALDAPGRDALAHEVQDSCQGHPERSGRYHYHSVTPCVDDGESGHSPLVGYALDGFGIYGHRGQAGEVLTNADLDECHGHSHAVEWDGQSLELYHYHATWEYRYTLGCYRGTPTGRAPG